MADSATGTTAKVYATITAQTAQPGRDAQGNPANGYRVYFKTAGGNEGFVFIPTDKLGSDEQDTMIRELAGRLDANTGKVV